MSVSFSRRRPGPISVTGAVFYVYLLASKPYGTLYIGVTSDLARRVWEHRVRAVRGFTAHDSADFAMLREKQIKEWKRDWKINLIERDNPRWIELYPNL
jgi:putative endonuclease